MSSQAPTLEVLLHPVRLRILQAVVGRTITTGELAQRLEDVAPATVYRHVNTLLEAGVLVVTSERRVRGAVERTLALDDQGARSDLDEIRSMSSEQHRRLFTVFLAHLASEVDQFLDGPHEDLMALFGYGQTALYVTESDLQSIQERFQQVIEPYSHPRGEGERRVSLATLLIPENEPPGKSDTSGHAP